MFIRSSCSCLTLGLVFEDLSRVEHWKLERELTENQEELEPEDFTEESERKEALDRTDRLEPQLEAETKNCWIGSEA